MPLTKKEEVLALADELQRPDLTREAVLPYLKHDTASIRAIAIRALGRLVAGDPTLIPQLAGAFEEKSNQVDLMGGIKVADLAIEALARAGTPEASRLAESFLSRTGPRRDFVIWYLKSEGLQLGARAGSQPQPVLFASP